MEEYKIKQQKNDLNLKNQVNIGFGAREKEPIICIKCDCIERIKSSEVRIQGRRPHARSII